MSARKALAVAKWAVSTKDERRLREVTAKHKPKGKAAKSKDDSTAIVYDIRPGESRVSQHGLGTRW